jgi:uncharacterized damage-inducible protein DinB
VSDLQTGLEAHHQAVEAFLTAARAVPAARWSQPRAAGKWSPGQVAEHLALAYEVNRGVLHGRAPGAAAPRLLRPLIRKFGLNPVLRRGRFIPGSKSPEVFRPGASPAAPAVLLERLRAAADAFEQDAAATRAAIIDHPFFGRLPLVDFVRLQEIHTQHHRGQLGSAAA